MVPCNSSLLTINLYSSVIKMPVYNETFVVPINSSLLTITSYSSVITTPVYSDRCSVVPITSSLLTITLYSSVITTPVYNDRCSVVPINSSLLTITLYSSVITMPVYNDRCSVVPINSSLLSKILYSPVITTQDSISWRYNGVRLSDSDLESEIICYYSKRKIQKSDLPCSVHHVILKLINGLKIHKWNRQNCTVIQYWKNSGAEVSSFYTYLSAHRFTTIRSARQIRVCANLVAHICVWTNVSTRKKKQEHRSDMFNGYHLWSTIKVKSKQNFKPDVNQLQANASCHFSGKAYDWRWDFRPVLGQSNLDFLV